MRISFAFLFLFFFACPEKSFSQNGTAVISMPGFFNPQQLRYKNCITTDNVGKVWIGTRDLGAITWDGSAWNYFDNTNGLTDNNIHCILAEPSGLMWIGTDTGGLCVFNGASWGNYSAWNSGIPSSKILCLFKQGPELWIGTDHGLAKYNGTTWTVYNTQNSGLPGDTVNKIAVSASGDVLAATSGGLIRFNGNSWYGHWPAQNAPITDIYVHTDGTEWLLSLGVVLKNTGNTFTALDNLYDFPWANFNSGIKMIGRGLGGGISFCGTRGTLNEIIGDRIHTYYPHGLETANMYSYGIFCYSASAAQLWMINQYSFSQINPQNALLLFDPQQYNGLGKGATPDNYRSLDVNAVKAGILNRGDMHWDFSTSAYHVPAGSTHTSVFCSSLWIGGLDAGGNLHEAAMTYRQNGMDFFPGPLDAQTGLCDSATAWKFDREWKTDRYKISEFQWQFAQGNVQNGTYIPSKDITDWPAIGNLGITQPLASFVDVNNNGIYDPLVGGDFPSINGDQEIFWVFNDQLATHTETDTAPLQVEVQAHAYGFACPNANDSDRAINYTTFYKYDIINRGNNTYHNTMLGFYQDVDLGNWQDDLVGCYPAANVGFVYNGEALDSAASPADYDHFPPIQSTVVLDGPAAIPNDSTDNDNDGLIDEPGEKNLLSGFIFFSVYNAAPTSVPTEPTDYYGYLNQQWKDSVPLTVGGNGYGGITPTHYMYPSLPDDTSGWNEMTAHHIPFDRTHLISSGPSDFLPGDTLHFTVALITSFDSVHAWNTHGYYQNMLRDVHKVQQWYAVASAPSCFPLFDAVSEQAQNTSPLLLYPNPAVKQLTVVYEAKNKNAVLEVYDISGKKMFAGMWNNTGTLSLPLDAYAAGIYFVRIIDGDQLHSQKFIKE